MHSPRCISEMQIKIMVRYHYTSIRMAKEKKYWQAGRQSRDHTLLVTNWYSHSENVLAVFYRVKHTLTI